MGRRQRARDAITVLRAALGTADLRRVQLAWASTQVAHWSFGVVLAVYAYDVGGAAAVGLVALLRMLPAAIAAPATSLLVDRFARRDVLLGATAARLLTRLMTVGAVATAAPLGVVAALAALSTIADTPYRPAMASLLPMLAREPRQMAACNVLLTTNDSVGFFLGALGGGLLAASVSDTLAFTLTTLPMVVAAVALARIPRDPTPEHRAHLATARVRDEMAGGLKEIAGNRPLRLVTIVVAAARLAEGAIEVTIVVIALELLDVGAAGVGWLNAAWGIGGIAGGAAALGLLGAGRLALGLAAGCLLIGLPFAAIAALANPVSAVVLLALLGVGYSLVEVAGTTLMQRLSSDETLGRVFGVQESLYVATTGVGSVLAPLLIALLGTRGAIVAIGLALPVLVLLRRTALARLEIGVHIPRRPLEALRSISLFGPVPLATVEGLASRAVEVDVQSGEDVIVQGDVGDRFYIVVDGVLEVFVDGVAAGDLGPGGFCGETALLHDVPRTATVRARTPALLVALERDDFLDGVSAHPRSHQAASAVAERHLAS